MSADMQIQIAITVVAVILAMIGGYWALAKMVVAQFNAGLDIRFEAMDRARLEGRKAFEERFRQLEAKTKELDSDVRRILIELPREYVRQQDYVRNQTVIEAKIDGLALKMENNWLKSGGRGD